jgi:ribosomal protein L21E
VDNLSINIGETVKVIDTSPIVQWKMDHEYFAGATGLIVIGVHIVCDKFAY